DPAERCCQQWPSQAPHSPRSFDSYRLSHRLPELHDRSNAPSSTFTVQKRQRPRGQGRRGRWAHLSENLLLAVTLAVDFAEELLAQTDRLRRDFYQLVVIDELQSLLKGELDRRHQGDGFVFTGSTHVVE